MSCKIKFHNLILHKPLEKWLVEALSSVSTNNNHYNRQGYQSVFEKDPHSVFPEELATFHKRYAIEYRNKYMLDKADLVVTYITHNFGGAAKFAKKAQAKNKVVINLTNYLI